MKKVLAIILAAAMLVSLAGVCFAADDGRSVADGTYTQTVYGNNPYIPFSVAVTFKNNEITDIEVVDRGGEFAEYDDSILQSAIDTFIPRIIEAQSIGVDATTGATLSCAGIRNAVRNAITEAGGNPNSWSARPEKSTETVIIEGYDVVVVGLGASGVSAYASAAQNGAKVLGIEAAARVGGTSSVVSGPMAVNPQDESVYDEAAMIDEEAFEAIWKADTDGKAKDELIDIMVEQSGDTIDWAIQDLGIRFYSPIAFGYPDLTIWSIYDTMEMSIADMFVMALERMKEYNEENDYMLETKATQILTDENGTVCGVTAVGYDGTTYEIYAPSVILCTGGFGGNASMTEDAYGYPIRLHGMYQNDGTMISYAINELNAGTFAMASAAMCHSGRVPNTLHLEGVDPSHNKTFSAIVNNADILAVNENGERFANEGGYMTVAEAYWHGGTEYYYAIIDQSYLDDLAANGFASVYMMINTQDFTNTGWYPMISDGTYELKPGDPITDMPVLVNGAIAANVLVKAESVEELAELLNMPELAATIEAYNAACQSGEDAEFGKDASMLRAIDTTGTLYAVKAAPFCYCTNGALDVNENIEVLDTEGNVIPGLYACGLDSMGVLFTEESGYIDYGGVAHGWCYVSGRIAGENAAAYAIG